MKNDKRPNEIDRTGGHEIIVNLPLQMSLYFNAYFMPFWLLVRAFALCSKYQSLAEIYQFLTVTSLLIVTVVEVPRLYLAFTGNLLEKVRELLGFWLLTIFIQFPVHLFNQFAFGLKLMPFERTVDVIMSVFVVSQMVLGFVAIRNIIIEQINRYKENNNKVEETVSEKRKEQ